MPRTEQERSARPADALSIARTYHDAWSGHQFECATALLSEGVQVEVPINGYPTKHSFAAALAGFGAMVEQVDLLAEMGDGEEAMLLYDIHVHQLGTIRIAEHFTVAAGQITRLRQIHDTFPIREAGLGPASDGYAGSVSIAAPRSQVYALLTTLDGLASWWTPAVTGSPQPGGELQFRFDGVDELIRMRVEAVSPDQTVKWTCLEHTGDPRWTSSQLEFDLTEARAGSRLRLRHAGVAADQVQAGWEHFLSSIADRLETGAGHPFGSA